MKGLILKDFYSLGYYRRIIPFMMALMAVIAFISKDTSFASTYLIVLLLLMTPTLFQFDESANWDRFAFALPLARKTIVGARYLFHSLMMAAAVIASILLNLVLTLVLRLMHPQWFLETAATLGVMLLMFLIVSSVILPSCYKFGPTKGRIYILLVTLVVFVAFVAAAPYIAGFLGGLSPLQGSLLLGAICLGGIGIFAASFFLSCRIVARKEA